jgi:hypothetical protein
VEFEDSQQNLGELTTGRLGGFREGRSPFRLEFPRVRDKTADGNIGPGLFLECSSFESVFEQSKFALTESTSAEFGPTKSALMRLALRAWFGRILVFRRFFLRRFFFRRLLSRELV